MSAGPFGWPQGPPPSRTGARLKFWGAAAVAVLLLGSAGVGIRYLRSRPHRGPVSGYEERVEVLQREYRDFYGRLMSDAGAERLFEDAARETAAGRYPSAIELLHDTAREAPLPVVFNNLGILLAETGERKQATAAFQEALARDPNSRLLQRNIAELGFNLEAARPVTTEVEPNNSSANANLIPLGKDVSAEMAGEAGDTDCFRFIAPAAPRDHIVIEIENRTPTLELGMRLYDGEQRLALDLQPKAPGQRIVEYIAPRPNTSWSLEFWSAHATSGDYTVRVSAMRSFDAYEPDDDIFAASRIEFGTPVEANIMDGEDTDYYAFESPVSGTVTVEVESRSATLIPALTTFGPDKRNAGFGPDVRTPGARLRHTMAVEAHRTYYLQVWGQAKSSGAYALTVR
jgi:hypothetical protein